MRKDIDRNITSLLYKAYNKVKDLNIIGGVLQQTSGGTGAKNLSSAYPYMVYDKYYTTLYVNNLNIIKGFTFAEDFSVVTNVNMKSMYIQGRLHVLRDSDTTTNEFCFFQIPTTGYNIENVKIAGNGTTMSIKNNIVRLSTEFGDSNEANIIVSGFIPFI